MKINNLIVTQNAIRNQVSDMIAYVKIGGIFSLENIKAYNNSNSLIHIARFSDGNLYIHDGHHRCISILLGGRNHLEKQEYYVKDWNYQDYLQINFNVWWVTPFDLKNEVRLPDIFDFKKHIKYLYYNQSPDHAKHYILTNKNKYATMRKIINIKDLL